MTTIAQDSHEVFAKASSGTENPSSAAVQLLREASLLVCKIAALATGKGAVLLASRQVEAADLVCHAPVLDAVIGGASVRGCDHFVPWCRVRWRRLSAVM